MAIKVPVGIGAPNVLQDILTGAPSNPTITDLTTVNGVVLHVTGPTGPNGALQATEWSATIVSATAPVGTTPSYLVWQHAFAGTECPAPGRYTVTAYLSVPGFADAIPCQPAKHIDAVPDPSL